MVGQIGDLIVNFVDEIVKLVFILHSNYLNMFINLDFS